MDGFGCHVQVLAIVFTKRFAEPLRPLGHMFSKSQQGASKFRTKQQVYEK
jgi:hypothetical protein